MPLMRTYYIGFFFKISDTSVDFKLETFDIFRFGNVRVDQISMLKLNLG